MTQASSVDIDPFAVALADRVAGPLLDKIVTEYRAAGVKVTAAQVQAELDRRFAAAFDAAVERLLVEAGDGVE